MAHATVTLNFNTFLKKAKLKDDGSNFVDWARNLKLILQAGKKDYVLNAALGDEPPATADQDVKNAWLARKEDYSIVQCAVLYGLEPGLQRRFERHGAFEMFQELKFIFQKNAGSRGMRPPINSMLARWRRTRLSVNMCSKCLGTQTV